MAATGPVNETLSALGGLGNEIMDFQFFPWGNAYCNGVTHPTNHSYYHCWVWGDVCGASTHLGKPNPNYPANLPAECYPPNAGDLINQHGPNEGKANIIEGCTKELYPDTYWNFVQCYENCDISRVDPASPEKFLQQCAAAEGFDATKIMACVNDPVKSLAINVANAKATNSLVPAHTGTPWITVNGKSADVGELLESVCKAYTGTAPLPPACKKFVE